MPQRPSDTLYLVSCAADNFWLDVAAVRRKGKAGDRIHPLVLARDSARLGDLMRDSVLLPHYDFPEEVQWKGCQNLAVFLFHHLTVHRVLLWGGVHRGSPSLFLARWWLHKHQQRARKREGLPRALVVA